MVSSTMLIFSRVSLATSSDLDNGHRSQINLHPHEGTNVSNLGGLGSESGISHSSSSRADLGGVELVGIDLAGSKGVAGKSDGSGTCCGSGAGSASSDGTVLNGRGSGEHARGGGSQDGSEKTLHVVDS
jgi:hypothetical protein